VVLSHPVWELTPAQIFSCTRYVRSGVVLSLETRPFTSPRRVLDGTRFTYQIGLGRTSKALHIQPLIEPCQPIPDSGDTRSGVLVYDGTLIIGSFIEPGDLPAAVNQTMIHEQYRGQGLGQKMVEMWLREIRIPDNLPTQHGNSKAVRSWLNAYKAVVAWAQAQGKTVPQRVLLTIERGAEEAELLRKAALAEV
jgi:hypothetical protein